MRKRHIAVAAIASGAILAGAVVGVLTYRPAPTQIVQAGSEPATEPGVVYDVPDWVREQGLYSLQTMHLEGKPEEVYGAATTTVARWVELEPGYASAVELTERTKDDPIYAVFVRGKWGVVGGIVLYPTTEGQQPQQPKMEYDLVAGRAILDKNGRQLNVQAWGEERPARPAFGPFNDQ